MCAILLIECILQAFNKIIEIIPAAFFQEKNLRRRTRSLLKLPDIPGKALTPRESSV